MATISETYIKVNQVSTKISTIGKSLGEKFNDSESLVIIIPGNPGINNFYDKFMQRIYENLKCTVWCIGHAGHNLVNDLPKFRENKDLYGLKQQIQHKKEFFEKYVPKNVVIHIIAHSIGSYITLELLEDPTIVKRVEKTYLLFPTIEYMAVTPNGKFLTRIVKYIVWLILILSTIFTLFPIVIQNYLLFAYMYLVGVPYYNLESIRQLVNPSILKRVFFLAFEEMDQVLQRNDNCIKQNLKKIKLFYGKTDGWAPLAYYDNIKKDYPNIDAEVTYINHAFVLKSGIKVADLFCDWVSTK